MIAVGNGEVCPFCKGKNKFINTPDGDFLIHLITEHQQETDEFLFGGKDTGV